MKRIVLSIGHGGGDPGAVNQVTGRKENDDAREICLRLEVLLKAAGVEVLLLEDKAYVESIKEVNSIFKPGDWAIEIHKDSFFPFRPEMKFRCGSYYYHTSPTGKKVSDIVCESFKKSTGNNTCWARPDNFSTHGGLGWNSMIRATSHIFELGFMQEDTGNFEFYANVAFRAILDVLKQVQ